MAVGERLVMHIMAELWIERTPLAVTESPKQRMPRGILISRLGSDVSIAAEQPLPGFRQGMQALNVTRRVQKKQAMVGDKAEVHT